MFLGRLMAANKIQGTRSQIKSIVDRANKAQVMLTWAGCYEANRSLSLLRTLYESLIMIESILIAGLTTIQMTEIGREGASRARYDMTRASQARVLRRWFRGNKRIPTRALLAEMGWTSIEWKLKTAKIRLWERAKSPQAGRDSNHIAKARMAQQEMGKQGEWDRMEDLGTEGRKMEIRKWGREADIRNWEKWQQTQKGDIQTHKEAPRGGKIPEMGRRAVVLKMLFRTGYANLRANKYEGRQAWCNLCDMKEAETEAHVLLRCPSFVPHGRNYFMTWAKSGTQTS